jgi:hypothetical protein
MSSPRHEDPFVRALAALPPVPQDEVRADRLRARCRARLERPSYWISVALESTAVGTIGAMYAWQLVKLVVR